MYYPDVKLFIGGQWADAADGKTAPVINPATGVELGRVACAGRSDLDQAVETARKGFEIWRDFLPVARARVMFRAVELLRERIEEIAQLMTLEQGKPVGEARAEVTGGADILEWFAQEGLRIYGRVVPSRVSLSHRQMVLREPVGPVAAFTPWNFPINQVVRKIAPALAAGCSVILKAPIDTPGSPAAFVKALEEAGLPPGVLNFVCGENRQISSYLIAHPVIRKMTFTGSTEVGKQLATLAGEHMKRASMELGGHAPVIVCEDADVEAAVRSISAAKFRNAGQVCISPTRFLVQKSIHDKFVRGLADHARGIAVGDGLTDGTQMGPLANPKRVTAMVELTKDALERGAELLHGGETIGDAGNFWQPTVIAGVPLDAKLFNEEPFGPVAAVQSFDTLEDAIVEANRLPYGLASYAFTSSLRNADLITRRVEAGMLWINSHALPSGEFPFGGIKDSGYGSEGGPEALESYLNIKSVSVMN